VIEHTGEGHVTMARLGIEETKMESASHHATPLPGRAGILDVVVIGAGFAGMYAIYSIRNAGLTVRAYETGDDVGGTWYWNRYPGARCDVESLDYSYSFSEELQQEWRWTERFPPQREILDYARHVADRFNLRPHIRFGTRVASAVFDEESHLWTITTGRGDEVRAKYIVSAVGCLTAATRVPEIPGLSRFSGDSHHTGRWPRRGVDFAGKRVGVIGTGSSGVQVIPIIAEQAQQLYVFQRTPNFSVPARNAPLDPAHEQRVKSDYTGYRRRARESLLGVAYAGNDTSVLSVSREESEREFEARWEKGGPGLLSAYSDLGTNVEANEIVADFVRRKIAATVHDPALAKLLSPTTYPIGAKRICVDTNYYDTFNRDNVTLVDIRETPIEEFTANGVRTADDEYDIDAIVFATGFDAMTGPLFGIDFRGRNGESLKDKWAAGPRTFLGIMTAGFPNLFTLTAPGSPSVLSNVIVSIEDHVDWTTAFISHMADHQFDWAEPTLAAEDRWVDHVNRLASQTLYSRADSWYLGANVPGKPRVFMPYVGGVPSYRRTIEKIRASGYDGFEFGR
jgi:cation diffusion facilitator CzcD-associated flavoprotein CzcO